MALDFRGGWRKVGKGLCRFLQGGLAATATPWPCVLIERGLEGEPADVDAIIRQWSAHPFMDFFVAVELLRLQCRETPPRDASTPGAR